jgi:hypothetical protein
LIDIIELFVVLPSWRNLRETQSTAHPAWRDVTLWCEGARGGRQNLGKEMIVTSDEETIPEVISRLARSTGILVLYSIDLPTERFVPQEDVRLHRDSVEFIDNDGAHVVLPFSRIARIEIEEGRD